MTEEAKPSLSRCVTDHRGAFVASLVVGAVLMLGIRSLFVDTDGSPAMAQAATATAHHAEPGHEGHAHGDPVAAPAPVDEDGHGSHGKKQDDDSHGGHEAGDEAKSDEKKQDHVGHDAAEAKHVPVLLDLGNASCPVMGGDADGKTFTEWNGLRVGHCCPGCTKRFLANPEALLDEVAPEWRAALADVEAVNDAEGAAREKAIATLRKKWKVVREPAVAERAE